MNNDTYDITLDSFVSMSKALSDPTRVRAVCALRKGELCMCRIIELLGLAPSTISKHMSILKQAGIVDSRKEGRWVYYRLAKEKGGNFPCGIIKQYVSALEADKQVCADDKNLSRIASIGLETLCKRQRGGD